MTKQAQRTLKPTSGERRRDELTRPRYFISIAAELASVHPRTLRIYEEEGLVCPQRRNNLRLYSEADIKRVRIIRFLTRRQGSTWRASRSSFSSRRWARSASTTCSMKTMSSDSSRKTPEAEAAASQSSPKEQPDVELRHEDQTQDIPEIDDDGRRGRDGAPGSTADPGRCHSSRCVTP